MSSSAADGSTTRAADEDLHDAPSNKRQRLDEAATTEKPAEAQAGPSKHSLAHRLAQAEQANAAASSESLVGITSYVNADLPAFEHAVIKHRFTDFVVWEIDQKGEVVRLHDISRPSSSAITSTSENAAKDTEEKEEKQEAQPEVNLEDHMTPEKASELKAFFAKGRPDGEDANAASLLSDPIDAKDKRKAFHGVIREAFDGKLVTGVQDGNIIKISWSTGNSKEQRSVRPSKQEQRDLPPYIQLKLQKTNRETQDCMGHLATRLGLSYKDVSTAGTKDKRGVTTQLVRVRRGKRTLEEVWDQVNGLHHGRSRDAFRGGRGRGRGAAHMKGGGGFLGRDGMMPKERGDRGMRIGDLSYADAPLELGMLEGNRFCIVLRDVRAPSDAVIDQAIATVQKQGFINYYGMQRFGNSTVPTHVIGLAILQSNWKEATRLILSEKSGDADEVLAARRAWTIDGNADKALKGLPKWAVAERSILEFFKTPSNEGNHNGALARIPKNLRLMYVHAYQSYVWNSAVSERIRLYGCTQPVAGDLVLKNPASDKATNEENGDDDASTTTTEAAPRPSGKVTQDSLIASSKTPKVKVLSEEDLPNYTIYDVVLPLPGYTVSYPAGAVGELYRTMLQADGLDIDEMFRPQKEYSLGGQYRKIMKRPNHLEWARIHYSDPNVDLIQPDEDKLLGMTLPPSAESGDKLALKLEFDLDSASYATMALREVLKIETSNVNQRALTEAMLDGDKGKVAKAEQKMEEA